MRLKDKVACITGAGSGIGRATARLFAEEGACVTVADWNAEGGERTVALVDEADSGKTLFVQTDVSIESQVQVMVAKTVSKFGKLDILINNAADREPGKPVTELPEQEWYRTVDTTLKGPYLCAKHSIPEMIKAGGGVIVNVSSIAGIVTFKNGPAYAASKAGLNQLTKNIALDYSSSNIRVNSINPGVINTPGIDRDKGKAEWREWIEDRTLLGRWGEPEEIAYPILFLASDESSFMTGSMITVDGGWTIR